MAGTPGGVKYSPRPTTSLDWGKGLIDWVRGQQSNWEQSKSRLVEGGAIDRSTPGNPDTGQNFQKDLLNAAFGGYDPGRGPDHLTNPVVGGNAIARGNTDNSAPPSVPGPGRNYDEYATSALDLYKQMVAGMLGDGGSGDRAAANQANSLAMEELALREAMLNGDYAEAQRIAGAIRAGKAQVASAYQDYNKLVTPVYDQSITRADQIYPTAKPQLDKILAEQRGGTAGHFEENAFATLAEGDLIGADDTAQAAAREMVGREFGLYDQQQTERGYHADRIMGAIGNVGSTGTRALKAGDEWDMRMRDELDSAQYDQGIRGADRAIEDIDFRRQGLELDKRQQAFQHDEMVRRISEDAKERGTDGQMDSIQFGQLTSEQYMEKAFGDAGIPLDRQMVLRQIMADAWNNGVFDPKDFRKWMDKQVDHDNPLGETRWDTIGASGVTDAEKQMLENAMAAYASGRNQWGALSGGLTSMGSDGYTGTSFAASTTQVQGSQAPRNKENAKDARGGQGVYGARAEGVASLLPQLEQMFGVQSWGQWRSLDQVPVGGMSSNSDHYSGGALDLAGTREQMKALGDYLNSLPGVSFVKGWWNDPSGVHDDHVHVSFMLPDGTMFNDGHH